MPDRRPAGRVPGAGRSGTGGRSEGIYPRAQSPDGATCSQRRPQTSDVSIFSRHGPPTSRPHPRDQVLIPSRFLTVPRPGEGLERPKTRKSIRL
eukprot:534878-Pyramimonas_sp.AAC.1